MCAPVLLEQRNSLLWECTHESWSSAKTPRTRKLRQGCAVPRPAWLQNCLNSDRGRRPSASFVIRMLYCLRGDTCEPRARRTKRAAFWDLTCDKNAKAYSLVYAETKRFLSSSLCVFLWEAVSQRRSAQAWVCRIKKLISGPFQGFFFWMVLEFARSPRLPRLMLMRCNNIKKAVFLWAVPNNTSVQNSSYHLVT